MSKHPYKGKAVWTEGPSSSYIGRVGRDGGVYSCWVFPVVCDSGGEIRVSEDGDFYDSKTRQPATFNGIPLTLGK